MLIDLHTHSKGISRCCQIDGKDMVLVAKNAGMDGIILTNHYDKNYLLNENEISKTAVAYIFESLNNFKDVKKVIIESRAEYITDDILSLIKSKDS